MTLQQAPGVMNSMSIPVERRYSPRVPPLADETYVQIVDWAGKRITRAKLLNVSLEGASVSSDSIFATSQRLWMRLEHAPETGWIEGEVVHFGSTNALGIRFHRPGRNAFFAAAVLRPGLRLLASDAEETA